MRDYLVQKGVDETRLESEGIGSNRPMVEGDTPEAYEANRRVEFHILVQRPKIIIDRDAPAPSTDDGAGD